MAWSWRLSNCPLFVRGSPFCEVSALVARDLKRLNIQAHKPMPPKVVEVVSQNETGLTNVRDFPVPMRHRSVRIELRNRSFRKGKSHDCSFYAWNRLGKKHLLRARRRRAGRGDGAPYGLTSQAR